MADVLSSATSGNMISLPASRAALFPRAQVYQGKTQASKYGGNDNHQDFRLTGGVPDYHKSLERLSQTDTDIPHQMHVCIRNRPHMFIFRT